MFITRVLTWTAGLRSMGIIEGPPAEIPLEERDPDTLTPSKMVQLVKFTKADATREG